MKKQKIVKKGRFFQLGHWVKNFDPIKTLINQGFKICSAGSDPAEASIRIFRGRASVSLSEVVRCFLVVVLVF